MSRERKVLIVEDSELQADIMAAMLEDMGMATVHTAGNGLLALQLFEVALEAKEPYSLVFLDIVMPEMDGQEALKRMRALEFEAGVDGAGRSIIIMTTALNSPQDMMEALIGGDCTDYVVKPVEEDQLTRILEKYGFLA